MSVNKERNSISSFIPLDRERKVSAINYPVPAVGEVIRIVEHRKKVKGGDLNKLLDGVYLVKEHYPSFIMCYHNNANVSFQINDFKRGAYRYQVVNKKEESIKLQQCM